ncbi:hypothetical protein J1N35_042960 [Gossypium stocksii]|uniref:Uncharacterized protein n=1 Tax=Gossypium stocksii TaxID=47602 RepID=A0A9D3ZEN8_9ROSI|nr:hypothetical protein J1N35_042960 [Gossypium stocksii]
MIHDSVMKIVKKREDKVVTGEADNSGRDFLGLLVNAYHEADEKNRLLIQDLVDMRIIALHHDLDLWGDDVDLFKPERFAEGIAEATKYNAAAFMPSDWDLELT